MQNYTLVMNLLFDQVYFSLCNLKTIVLKINLCKLHLHYKFTIYQIIINII